jgi:hypothetical protein
MTSAPPPPDLETEMSRLLDQLRLCRTRTWFALQAINRLRQRTIALTEATLPILAVAELLGRLADLESLLDDGEVPHG